MAQDLYEEIEAMFLKGNYQGAIRKCMDALNNGVRDYRVYILLAKSYFLLNDTDNSLKTVEDGLQVHPDNLLLLRAGARFSNEGKHDFDRSQKYINKMLEIDSDNNLANAEQSYLYLSTGKEDLAYQLIDQYVEKHPNDSEFRKSCAYDLVGYSYSCYTKAPDSEAYIIASEEDYQKCLDTCNKAASLYKDENVQTALENAQYYGTVEFNDENKENIMWLFIGGIIYLVCGIVFLLGIGFGTVMMISMAEMSMENFLDMLGGLLGGLVFLVVGILLIRSGFRLRKVSYRPYWQINKFIMTGKREKDEKKYIVIGTIFAGYMKWCIKFVIAMMKFAFYIAFH